MRRVIECLADPLEHYRYRLCVELAPRDTQPGAHLVVILKNPSAADATRRDPTVGKVEAWARRQGFARVTYLNLFAWRSPHPHRLNALPYAQAVGAENDGVILQTVEEVATENGLDARRQGERSPWAGATPTGWRRHATGGASTALLRRQALHRVGPLTQQGQPRHGLHWNGNLPLLAWNYKSRDYKSRGYKSS